MITSKLKAEVLALDVDDRLLLMDEIWESLEPESVEVPEHVKGLLDERSAAHMATPDAGLPLEEAIVEVRKRLQCRGS